LQPGEAKSIDRLDGVDPRPAVPEPTAPATMGP
jgi:hypothetical protein